MKLTAEPLPPAAMPRGRRLYRLVRSDRRAARRARRSRLLLDDLAAEGKRHAFEEAAARHHDHDTFPRAFHAQGRDRRASRSTINSIAKGAGMIAPDMTTMLPSSSPTPPSSPSAARLPRIPRRRSSTPSPSTATPRPATRCSSSQPVPRHTRVLRVSLSGRPPVAGLSLRRSRGDHGLALRWSRTVKG